MNWRLLVSLLIPLVLYLLQVAMAFLVGYVAGQTFVELRRRSR